MEIFDYIEQYAKNHGYGEKYILKNKFFSKSDMNQYQQMSGGVAFFYETDITGEIANVADMGDTAQALTFDSPTEMINLSAIFQIKDYNTVQQASTNFIYTADNICRFNLSEGAGCMFSHIYKVCIKYIFLIPSALYDTKDKRPYAEEKTLDLKLKI